MHALVVVYGIIIRHYPSYACGTWYLDTFFSGFRYVKNSGKKLMKSNSYEMR